MTQVRFDKMLLSSSFEIFSGDELDAEYVSFDQLLKESDFIIVSTALTPETKDLFNEEAFSKMKRNAILINTSRGGKF